MKLTAIILLSAVLQVSATGHAQGVNISVKDASLEQVFKEIKQQTGYTFFYADNLLQKAKKVTLSVKNTSIEEVLALCFKNQPLSYEIINQSVIIKEKESNTSPKENATSVDVPLIDISGKVTDADGNPLSGATVKVKGSNKLTTTNSAGVFVLKGVDNDATLEISFVGYEAATISVNNRSSISTSLKLNIVKNPEVIINKGYYSEKQKLSVSSVGRVTAAEIEKQPVQNVLLAVQAKVPGLFVTQSSGNAGGSVKVRIQGETSIDNGNDPLYVVDGVPIDPQLPTTGLDHMLAGGAPNSGTRNGTLAGWGNPLNYLNPLDIESVEVLKDADATAIYGSRAANGAILITTKKGKAGAMKLDLNMETGWGKMMRRVDMMNTRQYLDMRYEAFANDGINWRNPSISANDLKVWDTTRYTNWQDELLGGTARYNNINASVSGGSATMRYLVGGTYHRETTVFPLPKDFADQKASVHFNLNANNSNQKLKMQFSGDYMFDDNELPQEDFTQTALLLEPNAPPLLNADGSINWAPDAAGNTTLGDANVMVERYLKYVNKTHNLVSSLTLDYTILPGLNISSRFGYNYMQTNDFSPSPLFAVWPELRATTKRAAAFGDRNVQSWIIEPQASYRTTLKKGVLDLLVGSTFQNRKAVSGYIIGNGQLSDELLNNINAAASISNSNAGSSSNYRYNALFGRASYNWSDKYILTMNARRDGSTRFGADNRFHNFGSVGAAWIFSNDPFFKSGKSWLSFGKIRGNYGTTGSDQIGDYRFMSLYRFVPVSAPYQGIVGLTPDGLPNPNLQWEETRKLQLGIDLGFVHDKLTINVNYVRNRSANQLLGYSLPNPAGFIGVTENFPATVQNRNWEFIVTAKMIQKRRFTWTSSINLTLPQNKLIAFPDLENSTYSKRMQVGKPVDVYPYYHWLNVASGTGDYLYADINGHPTIAPDFDRDRTEWLSKFPKVYGGFQNSISYKNFQLDFIFQFAKQTGYNDLAFWNGSLVAFPGMFVRGYSNQSVTVLNRWQRPGDNNATVASYSTRPLPSYIYFSDRRFMDIWYIKLNNVSISWDLPQKWVSKAHFRSLRMYTHGQNLLTLSNYKGLNPETQSLAFLPPLQVWTVGLQAGL